MTPILSPELHELCARLQKVREQIKASGGFLCDRDLAECPNCGLVEDVLSGGKLVTYPKDDETMTDTGLRFAEVTDRLLRCLRCQTNILLTEEGELMTSVSPTVVTASRQFTDAPEPNP